MTKYDFILLSGDIDDFLKKLQAVGVVDITRSVKPIDESSEKMFSQAEMLRKALAVLKGVETAKPADAKVKNPAAEVLTVVGEKEAMKAQLPQLQREIEERKPWGIFDPEATKAVEKCGLKLHFYKAKTSSMDSEWQEKYALTEISSDGAYTYFVITTDVEDYSFPLKELPAPDVNYTVKEAELESLKASIRQHDDRLAVLKSYESDIQDDLNRTLSALDLHLANVSGAKAAENHLTVLEGFAPTESETALHNMLDNEAVFYLSDKAKEDDNPPIKLKNNRFVSMFEVLTDMYGRPKYDEFDPTIWISIFFMLFFAFCMGDAGYGLILILLSFALKKKAPKLSPLVMTLGLATTVIGLLFHTFFSIDLMTLSWIPDGVKKIMLPATIAGYDGTMVLAILVGIFHICLAMIIKTGQATKTKGFFNSLGTWGWTLLIVGGVVVGGLALIGAIDKEKTKWIVIVIGVLSAMGIFFLNDLHRNPLLNVGSGLWETYNTATGLLGDILSYLRLYALGLAGAKLGEAFNAIGLQALGDGGFGWVFFILIVVVGHVLNVAMCVLGAFVHPLRLNFLEFFKNSGYEGSGRKYNPLKENINN